MHVPDIKNWFPEPFRLSCLQRKPQCVLQRGGSIQKAVACNRDLAERESARDVPASASFDSVAWETAVSERAGASAGTLEDASTVCAAVREAMTTNASQREPLVT